MGSALQNLAGAGWSFRFGFVLLALALLWAAQNFFTQKSALVMPPTTKRPLLFQSIRFVLNFCAAVALILFCSRPLLATLLAFDVVLSVLILAYNHYFHHAFSVCYGLKSSRESFQVSALALRVISRTEWLVLGGILAAEILLVSALGPKPTRCCGLVAGGCALVMALMLLTLQRSSFDFASIRSTRVTRAVFVYGYFTSWLAEFCVAPDTRELARELAELQRDSTDRLSAAEAPWPFGSKIAVVQMESWDWNILNFRLEGQEVTPELNRLARSSRLFKLQAFHHVASLDMDYAALSGGAPSKRMVSYLVPDINYANALPRFLQRQGFHTAALHGNSGEFFNRRNNYSRMGFNELWFQEEFRGLRVSRSYWGVRDEEIFRISSEKLRATNRPEFHFIITLDSHVPFDLLNEAEKELFPRTRGWHENFFNSMRLLDRTVDNYIKSLPLGTLVILYGDHTSGVNYGDFRSAREGSAEFVPCLVHVCQVPLPAAAQASEPEMLPMDLRILDVMNCLRRQIAARRQPISAISEPVRSRNPAEPPALAIEASQLT